MEYVHDLRERMKKKNLHFNKLHKKILNHDLNSATKKKRKKNR